MNIVEIMYAHVMLVFNNACSVCNMLQHSSRFKECKIQSSPLLIWLTLWLCTL